MKPMLAVKAPAQLSALGDLSNYLVFPKLDGIRACVVDGKLLSRTGKPIPNKELYARYSKPEYNGFDGELIFGEATAPDVFQRTTSAVMTHNGSADGVGYFVFDDFSNPADEYMRRYSNMMNRVALYDDIAWLNFFPAHNIDALLSIEHYFVDRGYEGIILRKKDAPYKFGRSTVNEGGMVKMKRFDDAEAIVLDIQQLVRQNGDVDETLGAIVAKDVLTGVEFNVGTGFTQQQRQEMWQQREALVGKVFTYKYFSAGMKYAPRFPVFYRFREEE